MLLWTPLSICTPLEGGGKTHILSRQDPDQNGPHMCMRYRWIAIDAGRRLVPVAAQEGVTLGIPVVVFFIVAQIPIGQDG
jgi:hypothetical protein